MINRIKLLRNIGQFDSVDTGATIDLGRLVLVYAENGRGKTTLAAVFRSLATNDPLPIIERSRLAAQHSPHIVLECEGGPPDAMFQDGAWNHTGPQMALFDDVFVDQNIHSGLAVDPRHRQNLHELVLGVRGVRLSRKLQRLVSRIEEHNRALREKSDTISESERGGLSADDFCTLPELQDVDAEIEAAERALAAARDQDAVCTTPLFEPFRLPAFDTGAISDILAHELSDLDAAAEARVRAHVEALGPDGEQWVSDGMQRITPPFDEGTCPFCAQDLAGSALLSHYRAYFSEGYTDLKRKVEEILATVRCGHAGNVAAAFERAVRMASERRQFWSRFCEVPEVSIDTVAIANDWNAAREGVLAALTSKQASPLERRVLAEETRVAIAAYEVHRQTIAEVSASLTSVNEAVQRVKDQAAEDNRNVILTDLSRLRATKARHLPEIADLCDDYVAEKEAKARTEIKRTVVRTALDGYQTNAFPASQATINQFLSRFNAGFSIDRVTSAMTRGGATCTYDVVINGSAVAVASSTTPQGVPSFSNTLSAGDRNTLALAFFFASLRQDPDLGNKVVLIDDPISSLDDHRSLTTVQEVRRLAGQAGQVFVLSHDKRFLCDVWAGADPTMRVALEIARDNAGSTLRTWSVGQDSITEHDRRHARMRDYVNSGNGDLREVASSIRLHLEGFLRVAQPEQFPPGTMLGPFLNRCRERLDQPDEILDRAATAELSELVEYANRFHHNMNLAQEIEVINDSELRGFVERALNFASR